MPISHVIGQSVIEGLPIFLLATWYRALQSHSVDIAGLTIETLVTLFTNLGQQQGVDFCGFLVCRNCLANLKRSKLKGRDAGLHKYLTFLLHKVANEGDSDTCHRAFPNSKLKPKIVVPREDQVAEALRLARDSKSVVAEQKAQRDDVPSARDIGVEGCERGNRVLAQVGERRGIVEAPVSSPLPRPTSRLPEPPKFWIPYAAHFDHSECKETEARQPSSHTEAAPNFPRTPRHRRSRSRSPDSDSTWSEISNASIPSLFDDVSVSTCPSDGELSPSL